MYSNFLLFDNKTNFIYLNFLLIALSLKDLVFLSTQHDYFHFLDKIE